MSIFNHLASTEVHMKEVGHEDYYPAYSEVNSF